jgi:hypothetical protein
MLIPKIEYFIDLGFEQNILSIFPKKEDYFNMRF